jgi:hypothetical protein
MMTSAVTTMTLVAVNFFQHHQFFFMPPQKPRTQKLILRLAKQDTKKGEPDCETVVAEKFEFN